MPIANAEIMTKIHIVFLFAFNFSHKIETIVSISDIEDVRAASKTKIKNTAPIIFPPDIEAKTFGSVINISFGPALRASLFPPENAKTAGIIIIPEIKATAVSNSSICLTDFSRLSSLRIYEP